jgi:hypothetical protein
VSIEALIAFVLFLLVPLVERLLREVQQRNHRGEGRPGTPPEQGPLPNSPAPQPLTVAVPSVSAATTEMLMASRARPADAARRPVRTMTPRAHTRPAAARLALRDPSALRRAVVQMTILGPCRAVHPYDWPERPAP